MDLPSEGSDHYSSSNNSSLVSLIPANGVHGRTADGHPLDSSTSSSTEGQLMDTLLAAAPAAVACLVWLKLLEKRAGQTMALGLDHSSNSNSSQQQ